MRVAVAPCFEEFAYAKTGDTAPASRGPQPSLHSHQ